MAQTIEAFVGDSVDNAKISPLHRKVIGLIAAGYFFDVIDFVVFGSLVPFMLVPSSQREPKSRPSVAPPFSACSSAPPARVSLATVSAAGSSISSICCCLACSRSLARSPQRDFAHHLPVHRRPRAWRRAAALLRIRQRIFAKEHPRPYSGNHTFRRRRLRVADRNPDGSRPRVDSLEADYVWRTFWVIVGVGALIVWVFRLACRSRHAISRPTAEARRRSTCSGGLEFHPAAEHALDRRCQQHQERSIRRRVPHVPTRVIAGMICFPASFGVAIGLVLG